MSKAFAFLAGLVLGVHAGAILYVWAREIVIDAAVRDFVAGLDDDR